MGYNEQSDIINKNIETHRNSSEPIGTHITKLSKLHDLISCQKGAVEWVTMGYNEQSDIINKNIETHRNSSKLI